MDIPKKLTLATCIALIGCNQSTVETCDPMPSFERSFNLVWPNSPQSSLAKVVVRQNPRTSQCGSDATMTVQVIHATTGAVSFDLELTSASDKPWSLLAKIPRISFDDTLTLSFPQSRDLSSGSLSATVTKVYGLVPLR